MLSARPTCTHHARDGGWSQGLESADLNTFAVSGALFVRGRLLASYRGGLDAIGTQWVFSSEDWVSGIDVIVAVAVPRLVTVMNVVEADATTVNVGPTTVSVTRGLAFKASCRLEILSKSLSSFTKVDDMMLRGEESAFYTLQKK